MQNTFEKLRNIKPKSAFNGLLHIIENHTLTVLILVAGGLIGFALFSVNSLTQTASQANTQVSGDSPTPLASLNIQPETKEALLALQQDEDVTITSIIATYRRSAFSGATDESKWVIESATALEEYKAANNGYPTQLQIINVLRDAVIETQDSAGRLLNTAGSDYSYSTERCDGVSCSGFSLASKVGDSVYQLGETDSVKRSWVNNTSEALNAYSKSATAGLYPTEQDFIKVLSSFYEETLNESFASTDPRGNDVDDDDSAYSYNGIDCTTEGCGSFVLRTTFKDGALYFQQSK